MCWPDGYADDAYAKIISLAEQHPDQLISALIERSFGRRIDAIDQQV